MKNFFHKKILINFYKFLIKTWSRYIALCLMTYSKK